MEKATVQRDEFVVRQSFVIRIWREAGQSAWRGWVRHVHTGEEVCVHSQDELIAFIESWAGRLSDSSTSRLDTPGTGLK
ncbi:MAG TPA: hypothetical protein PKV20_07305 [Anaerolineae bacterium]|mgnify:CR=1 FL=1|nr:hypothetical protein [Anaerolineae bacterium]